MTAEAFLAALEKKDLVDPGMLDAVRTQISGSKTRVSARQVAKLLIDKKLLTVAVAQRLLGAHGAVAAKPVAPSKPVPTPKPAARAPRAMSGAGSLLDEELPPLPADAMLGSPLSSTPMSLDGLMSDPSLAEAAVGAALLERPKPAGRKSMASRLRRLVRAGRKSSWLWIVAIAAGVLAVLGIVVWVVSRPSPETLLEPADELFASGSYAAAMARYDEYLERFPKRPAASRARVRRGLAQLQLAMSGTIDGAAALACADGVLGAIGVEPEFDAESGPILSVALPEAARQLAAAAARHPGPVAFDQARRMLAVARQFIPAADRPLERLARTEAVLALAQHRAARDPEVKQAASAMRQAASARKFAEAYRARDALLKSYPEVAQYSDLVDAAAEIGFAEPRSRGWRSPRRRRPTRRPQGRRS